MSVEEVGADGMGIRTYSRALRALGAERVYVAAIGHGADHLHVHLLPRWPGTQEEIAWHSVDDGEGARRVSAEGVEQLMAAVREQAS